jgi:cardiolipin synthase
MNNRHEAILGDPSRADIVPERRLADIAFSRAAGAPLIVGNTVRLLKDAAENYPAWLDAMTAATTTIHFEIYIFYDDEIGTRFAEVLTAKSHEGVRVRLLYDWFGSIGKTSSRFWRKLCEAGVEVRCVNPFRFSSPFGWVNRDHRKMLAVDGHVAFVTGLCVGKMWVGDPEKGIEPWRDTGIEIRGPAVADIEYAFAQVWATAGPSLPLSEIPRRDDLSPAGNVGLRVIASEPSSSELYRLDTLVATGVRRSLWLTDAYFIGTTPYVRTLIAAAQDGVDVRLLVPGSSDLPFVRTLSRAGYRSLLEGDVRVFEWNGPMLHAKTAVADGQWARVGSTNLNPASWVGNWELDVAVENEPFAQQMEALFLDDLKHATEIVLNTKKRVRSAEPIVHRASSFKHGRGSAGRAMAGALRLSNVVGAAITNRRALGPAEATVMTGAGISSLFLAVAAILWPRFVTVPLAIIGTWIGVALLGKAYIVWKRKRE